MRRAKKKQNLTLQLRLYQLFSTVVSPKSSDKDQARREFILNVILLGWILLSLSSLVIGLISYIVSSSDNSAYLNTLIVVFFVNLLLALAYLISRKGFVKLISILIVLIFFSGSSYTAYIWGANTPQSLLIYALVVVVSGILVGSRFSMHMTFSIIAVIFALIYLQASQVIPVNSGWKNRLPSITDSITYSLTIFTIYIVSWLFNRDLEATLKRAQLSESQLRRQRNNLQITVNRRTRELEVAQAEKLSQLYRFAEFGKASSGMFHDLINPLTLISLNLRHLKQQQMSASLERAILGTRRLERFILAARKQLQNQSPEKLFSLNREVENALLILNYQARQAGVSLQFLKSPNLRIFGDPVKFNQLVTNLVSNAIDAYQGLRRNNKTVELSLTKNSKSEYIIMEVTDRAKGIPQASLSKIFTPLYTTKSGKGMGMGLSIAKEIVEKHFKGRIEVTSTLRQGAKFKIFLRIVR